MSFSFECGVCSANYVLDEDQITQTGVKITCPKCFNFFILKKGFTAREKPIVEKIALQDGHFEINHPPLKEGEPNTDDYFNFELSKNIPENKIDVHDLIAQELAKKSNPKFKSEISEPTMQMESLEKQLLLEKQSGDITQKQLGIETSKIKEPKKFSLDPSLVMDFPADETKQTGTFESMLIWLGFLIITLASLFFLAYFKVINVPYLDQFIVREQMTPTPTAIPTEAPKYGFPVIE